MTERYITVWEIEWNRQVLNRGTWDDEDPDWEWHSTSQYFVRKDDAEKVFKKQIPTSDVPIIRLYELLLDTKYDSTEERELLDDKESVEEWAV